MTQAQHTSAPRARVLVLASTFPAHPGDSVPSFVRDQVEAMAAAHPELELHVLAPHDARTGTCDLTKHTQFTEHRYHYMRPRSWERLAHRGILPALRDDPRLYAVIPFLFLGQFIATLQVVRRLRPVMMYAHWFTPQAVVASWVTRLTGTPFVVTTHAADVEVWRKVPLVGAWIVRSTARRALAISAVSARSKRRLTDFFEENPPTVEIIPMGVHPERQEVSEARKIVARAELGAWEKTIYLFLGRLVEKKGLPYLLEALVRADMPRDWMLLVAGDGPLRREWETLTERLGLADRVLFLGHVADHTKAACLDAADVLVVPSVTAADGDVEGFPVVLLEGLGRGLLCVATYESGADDALEHGRHGLLCHERDPAALAACLVRLRSLPAEVRADMRVAARQLATYYEWPDIAERHVATLIAPVLRQRAR